ncbi:hypothetical protein JAAARDRAFT_38882 [Jaapia argillacea MUCL 33604]|uniref:Phospholipid/glycerol acyltransferase domain-containing protein n=1 Tax=Jaapia argillacea MUCL 33604 TaxID=933084 RepID=A0A067PRH5_9AGAM|nr:hypothetical protein JAAARDRAFT_38882 [Jaapia argillacea MUCL 33604]
MMEPKLVYRILRYISDLALSGFYEEVCVEGQENVPEKGGVIIASTHHNEIIDIATLAATIPHRRHVSFWAKSTMFSNPISKAILDSSGAIPVTRNLNSSSQTQTQTQTPTSNSSSSSSVPPTKPHAQTSLFTSTSLALASSSVVGVFPEGTSYTEPGIVQVKEGAAWAGVEFVRWVKQREREGRDNGTGVRAMEVGEEELVIVPTPIVYTDKSQYLSRVCVKYGKPIKMSTYKSRILACSFPPKLSQPSITVSSPSESSIDVVLHSPTPSPPPSSNTISPFPNSSDSSSTSLSLSPSPTQDTLHVLRRDGEEGDSLGKIVKEITREIEKGMVEASVNAPDWDTLLAARLARDIVWGDEKNLPLEEFVDVTQRYVDLFSPTTASSSVPLPPRDLDLQAKAKSALLKYHSLLYHTKISHASLEAIFPLPRQSSASLYTRFTTLVSAIWRSSGERTRLLAPPQPSGLLPLMRASIPGLGRAMGTFVREVVGLVGHPRLWVFLTPGILWVPGYVFGLLASKFLAPRGEEEAQAQFKVIFGGVGIGFSLGGVGWGVASVWRGLGRGGEVGVLGDVLRRLGVFDSLTRLGVVDVAWKAGRLVFGSGNGTGGFGEKARVSVGYIGVVWFVGWAIVKWHNMVVGGNYTQFKRLRTSYKVLIGLLSPPSSDVPLGELGKYTKPPARVENPFIKRKANSHTGQPVGPSNDLENPAPQANTIPKTEAPPPVASRKLIRHLLEARWEAWEALMEFACDMMSGHEGWGDEELGRVWPGLG